MAEEYIHFCGNCQAKLSVPEPGEYHCPKCDTPFVIEGESNTIIPVINSGILQNNQPAQYSAPGGFQPPPVKIRTPDRKAGYYGKFTSGIIIFAICMCILSILAGACDFIFEAVGDAKKSVVEKEITELEEKKSKLQREKYQYSYGTSRYRELGKKIEEVETKIEQATTRRNEIFDGFYSKSERVTMISGGAVSLIAMIILFQLYRLLQMIEFNTRKE